MIEKISGEKMPTVIFVTAYDQFALKAFEVHAVDYLLKPLNPERLKTALQRAMSQIQQRQGGDLKGRALMLVKPDHDFAENKHQCGVDDERQLEPVLAEVLDETLE